MSSSTPEACSRGAINSLIILIFATTMLIIVDRRTPAFSTNRLWALSVDSANQSETEGRQIDPFMTSNGTLAEEYVWKQQTPMPEHKDTDCTLRYSQELIHRWKALKKDYCLPSKEVGLLGVKPSSNRGFIANDGSPTTSITCYKMNEGLVENICDVRNFALDVDRVLNTTQPGGTVYGTCELDTEEWQRSSFGHAAQEWLYSSFEGLQKPRTHTPVCDAWVEHDVYFVIRYDTSNMFHFHEDLMQAWSSMVVAGVDPEMTESVILDARDGTRDLYQYMWEKVFTGDRVIEHLKSTTPFYQQDTSEPHTRTPPQNRDVRQIAQYYRSKGAKTVCFSRGIFGPHGGVSPFSRSIGEPTGCHPDESALFLGFRQFVLSRLDTHTHAHTHTHTITPHTPVRITFSSRRQSVERAIKNERALLLSVMEKMCAAWDKIATQPGDSSFAPLGDICGVTFDVVDFADGLSIRDQIALAHSTDILIGAHGAALTLSLYQPIENTTSALIEIQSPTRYGNYHFENIASKMGHLYACVQTITDDIANDKIEEISNKAVEFAVEIHNRRRQFFRRRMRRRAKD